MCATSLEGRTSLQKRTMAGGGVGDGGKGSRPAPSPSTSPGLSCPPWQSFLGCSPLSGAPRDDFDVVVVEEQLGSRLQEAVAAAVASRNLVTSFIPSLRRLLTASFLEPPEGQGGMCQRSANGQIYFYKNIPEELYRTLWVRVRVRVIVGSVSAPLSSPVYR